MTSQPDSGAIHNVSRISPLARRLVILTVLFSTFVALVTTAVQLFFDYRRELVQVENTFELIQHSYIPSIANALWSTNGKEIQIALDGLSRIQDVQFVSVNEQDRVWAQAGESKLENIQARTYPLTYWHRDKHESIGTLHVVVNMAAIYQRLIDKFWVILITNGIKTFLVSGFMLWLFYWLVTRHLHHIARFATGLGVKNLDKQLQLARKNSLPADEFDLLVNGLTRMQANLKSALHTLELDIAERKAVESALRHNEQLLAKSQEMAQIGSFQYDVRTNALTCSRQLYQIIGLQTQHSGFQLQDLIGMIHPDDQAFLRQIFVKTDHDNKGRAEGECRLIHGASELELMMYVKCEYLYSRENEYEGLIAMLQDITARKQAEELLKLSSSVFKHSHQGIMVTDAEGTIVDVNPAFTTITGYQRGEVLNLKPNILRSYRQSDSWYRDMWQTLKQKGHWTGEIWNKRKNGEVYPELEDISAVRDNTGKIINYVAVFTDITMQKQHESELDRIAHYDQLTGLPNRRLLIDRLDQAMSRAARENKLLAIAYVDLDGFKPINDQYGHAIGDRLLVEVSHRLKDTLRSSDTLARLGGDEFVMLLSELDHREACLHSLERALSAVSSPVIIDGIALEITASIGVTLYPSDNNSGDTLLRHADRAMYTAKQAGKNGYHLFDPELDREQQDQQAQIIRLYEALNKNEFVLYYQPKVNIVTGEVMGCEALIRWQHPQDGLQVPAAFLALLSKHPLEIEVGKWVIETALQQLQSWLSLNREMSISVNISAYHLLHPEFVSQLQTLLAKYPRVPPGMLELEVLETAAMSDLGTAIEVMSQCKAIGVHLSLDDFGTGYSSLSYFRHFPVDILKIDKSFIHDMIIDRAGMAMVESVVRIAELFERLPLAEGVETEEQIQALIKLGCHYSQGYLIARPMPIEDISDWLEDWHKRGIWRRYSSSENGDLYSNEQHK